MWNSENKPQRPALQKTDIFTIQRDIFFLFCFYKVLVKGRLKKKKEKPQTKILITRIIIVIWPFRTASWAWTKMGRPRLLPGPPAAWTSYRVWSRPRCQLSWRTATPTGEREKKKSWNRHPTNLSSPRIRCHLAAGWSGDALWARPEPGISHHHSNTSHRTNCDLWN